VEMSLSSHTAPHHPLPLPRHLPHPGICPICRNLLYSHRRAVFPRVCLLARPALAEAGLMFCPCFLFIFLTISVRPIISTPMAIDELPEVSFFDPLSDVVVVTNFCWLINTIEFRRHSADSGRRLAAVQFGYAVHLVLLSSWASAHRGKWGQLQCCWKNG